ncbi:hypothetical protein VTK56DRAFT_8746 [Thermocarpiscus australiensis]
MPARKGLTALQESSSGPRPLPEVWWFTAHPPLSSPSPDPNNNRPPGDDRKVKLGKTLRILQERLPTLLQTPLPHEVLSPHITLHLFPSTHPHLPTVTGRVAYLAALWSSPIAWNRVPLVGNVRLQVLSERVVDNPALQYPSPARIASRGGGGGGGGGGSSSIDKGGGGLGEGGGKGGGGGKVVEGAVGEQLIVRWRTVGGGKKVGDALKDAGWLPFVGNGNGKGRRKGKADEEEGAGRDGKADVEADAGGETEVKAPVGTAQPVGASDKEFTGLFIFDFDSEGRILSHTIEHVHAGGQWEKGVGAKVVGLTDWLLGGMKGGEAPCPAFARAKFRKAR